MNKFALLIAIIGVFDLSGTLCAKFWSLNRNIWLLISTGLFFALAGIVLAFSMRYENMVIANILWIAISTILITLFGYFYFRESVSLVQLIGIILTVVGVTLISSRG